MLYYTYLKLHTHLRHPRREHPKDVPRRSVSFHIFENGTSEEEEKKKKKKKKKSWEEEEEEEEDEEENEVPFWIVNVHWSLRSNPFECRGVYPLIHCLGNRKL